KQSGRDGPGPDPRAEKLRFDVRLLEIIYDPAHRKFLRKRMHKAFLIKHGVFVRVIYGPLSDQLGDKRRLSGEAFSRYDDRLSLPADHAGVQKNALSGKFGDRDPDPARKIFDEPFFALQRKELFFIFQNADLSIRTIPKDLEEMPGRSVCRKIDLEWQNLRQM